MVFTINMGCKDTRIFNTSQHNYIGGFRISEHKCIYQLHFHIFSKALLISGGDF